MHKAADAPTEHLQETRLRGQNASGESSTCVGEANIRKQVLRTCGRLGNATVIKSDMKKKPETAVEYHARTENKALL